MKKIVAVMMLLFVFGSANLLAVELSAGEVYNRSVMRLLAQKYDATMNDSDWVLVKSSGYNINVRVYDKSKVIRFNFWYDDNKKDKYDLLRAANKFNNDWILIRASVDDNNYALLDYYLPYDGGINSKNLYAALEWFIHFCKEWDKVFNKL